jgi:SAM-dependent methyltransferase
MKIHFACGKRVLPSYVNVDAVANPGAPRVPEYLYAMRFDQVGRLVEPMPFPDACADELLSVHFFEHVYSWEAPSVLAEWHRVLKPGGQLVLEMPDLLKCARNLIKHAETGGKPLQQMGLWGVYGDDTLRDPYMCHKWGWWPATLKAALLAAGLIVVRFEVPVWHPAGRHDRDMRAVARKP